MIDILIPSYHRHGNLKTVNYFLKIGWDPKKIHVLIDSEADDRDEYRAVAESQGFNLHVFDMEEARERYDYVHRPSVSRRSAGQARNMFQGYAKAKGIDFYMVQDDDTNGFEMKRFGMYRRIANRAEIEFVFDEIEKLMRKRRIGMLGLSQTGDFIGGYQNKLFRMKVMNATFYLMPYVYRGERGVQDDDTSLFCGVYNEGLFTGSLADGLVLKQTESATAPGGLTDLYNENKLLNKSLITPIQFPSAIYAEKQVLNGGRLHHHIQGRYLIPKILKMQGGRDNIAWDTYPEDYPFTNEPRRTRK